MWQEFSSPNLDPNWQKSKKTRGVGWENVHKKLSHESNTLYLAYNIPLRLLYRSPPPNHPNFTLCAPQQRCTLHQDNNHSKQGRQRPNGGGQKFVCSLEPTVFAIFLLTTDFWQYNIVLFFHFRSFLRKLNMTTFLFNTPSFLFYFWCVFGSFFGIFRSASFNFLVSMHLCIYFSNFFGNLVSSSI